MFAANNILRAVGRKITSPLGLYIFTFLVPTKGEVLDQVMAKIQGTLPGAFSDTNPIALEVTDKAEEVVEWAKQYDLFENCKTTEQVRAVCNQIKGDINFEVSFDGFFSLVVAIINLYYIKCTKELLEEIGQHITPRDQCLLNLGLIDLPKVESNLQRWAQLTENQARNTYATLLTIHVELYRLLGDTKEDIAKLEGKNELSNYIIGFSFLTICATSWNIWSNWHHLNGWTKVVSVGGTSSAAGTVAWVVAIKKQVGALLDNLYNTRCMLSSLLNDEIILLRDRPEFQPYKEP